MSVPRDHHYLPQFYLERWAVGGEVVRYVRPTGSDGPLHCKSKAPRAIAYERDLYQLPDVSDPVGSQRLELRFFQQIDDRAASALQKLDTVVPMGGDERVALARFMVSLLHRSPSRLKAIRAELARQTAGAPYEGLEGDDFERVLKATANRLIEMLISSPQGSSLIAKFGSYRVDVGGAAVPLLTSDRPVTVSAQLVSPDAFMILPYAPDRLLILARDAETARAFTTQPVTTLVKGINRAVVEQSEDVVVASDRGATAMIDRLFLRKQPGITTDPIGLIRRKSPLIDLRPKVRSFSRHDKSAIKYLGR